MFNLNKLNDLPDAIAKYLNLDGLGKKLFTRDVRFSFGIAFGLCFIIFLYYYANHPMGNHDWYRIPYAPLDTTRNGRWLLTWLNDFVFGGMRLPIVQGVVATISMILAGILTCFIYSNDQSPPSKTQMIMVSLLISLIPYTTVFYYYSLTAYAFSISYLLAVIAIYFLTIPKLSHYVLSAVVVFLTMSLYQPAGAVLLPMYIAYTILETDKYFRGRSINFRDYCCRTLFSGTALAGGLVIYKIQLIILDQFGILTHNYITKEATLSQYLDNLIFLIKIAFTDLFQAQYLFSSQAKLILFLLICFAFIIMEARILLSKKKSWIKLAGTVLVFLMFIILILSTKLIYIVSAYKNLYAFRMHMGSIALYAFALFVCLSIRPKLIRIVTGAFAVLLLINFMNNQLLFQALQVRGNLHDLFVYSSIYNRITELKGFDPDRRYRYVFMGSITNYKYLSYRPDSDMIRTGDHLIDDRIRLHISVFQQIYAGVKFAKIPENEVKRYKEIVRTISKNMKPWPSSESVRWLDQNTIFIYLSQGNGGPISFR